MKVEIYSDISCPWCYVGKRNFQRALAAFHGPQVEVVPRAYQIDGELPELPVPLLTWIAGKYGDQAQAMSDQVTEVGKRLGIDFHNDIGYAVNTLDGHRLLWFALREYGPAVHQELEELVFAAYFTEGGNVADRELLADRAAVAGLDRDQVLAFLASDQGTAEVRAEIRAARTDGVTTVPTFVIDGKWRLQGAQDASAFLRALEAAAAESEQSARSSQGGACADGACAV
ncbi:DsbA family oxidoreductase [Kitasatospora sp. MAP5-34]|uniref:DsbA family oxidoreductase n=1 Tax=Kitasatospora sp. MAP5-34 TaxID=3035102 RepID=UPI002472F9FE|nr:DsbA family oxidoreductase [Kitasatospora sp. MAP5-34]MDH6579334.1 putative DsbA family dithiol-disulfide isomerase [Kitasatospora sp. MAP5-34]